MVGSEGADVVDLLLRRGKERFEWVRHLEVPRNFRLDLVEVNTREQRLDIDLLGLNGRG